MSEYTARLRGGRFGGTLVTLYNEEPKWLYLARAGDTFVDLYQRTETMAHDGQARVYEWNSKCTECAAEEKYDALEVTYKDGDDDVTLCPWNAR